MRQGISPVLSLGAILALGTLVSGCAGAGRQDCAQPAGERRTQASLAHALEVERAKVRELTARLEILQPKPKGGETTALSELTLFPERYADKEIQIEGRLLNERVNLQDPEILVLSLESMKGQNPVLCFMSRKDMSDAALRLVASLESGMNVRLKGRLVDVKNSISKKAKYVGGRGFGYEFNATEAFALGK